MSPTPARSVGIAWYRLDHYDRAVASFIDGASFPKTHASWRHKAGRMERELKRQGLHPVRVEIDPDRFAGWCSERSLAPDSVARNRYVAEVAESTPVDADLEKEKEPVKSAG